MLCLHESLKAQGESFRLLVLCFDAETEAVVAAAGDESLVAVPLAELLAADLAYAAVRSQRSRVEFYFTSTPVLVRYCLAREATAERMTYLDADLFFFGPASAVFAEQAGASVGIVPHRFPDRLRENVRFGRFNVGWVSFRRDADGLACLDWWRERCLEWCHDHVDNGRFADQGYLDEFHRRFSGVCALEHPGVNAAPWNVSPSRLALKQGAPWLEESPVLFYHYQGIRYLGGDWFDPGLKAYQVKLTPALKEWVYLPYLRRLAAMQLRLKQLHGIDPLQGYQRLPEGGGIRSRWERIKARWLLFVYRRCRGELVRCAGLSR
jgi:hypothetical protein